MILYTLINPLITNDAYMLQIVAYVLVPMMHICTKDEGVYLHGIFGCYEMTTAIKHQTLPEGAHKAAKLLALRTDYCRRGLYWTNMK